VRAIEPVEAQLLEARHALRKSDLARATNALEAAYTGLRAAPWVEKGIVERSFPLAQALASQSAPSASRLFQALNQPFVLRLLDHGRLLLALDIASRLPGDECLRVLAELEPNVPWQQAFLDKRLRCYERRGHPRKAEALADVREFLDNTPSPFMDGFDLKPGSKEPSAPAAPPGKTGSEETPSGQRGRSGEKT
jgi:hypothetical protein